MPNSQFERIFQERHERAERYSGLLPETDDVTLTVLKGHLVVEELLYAIAEEHLENPQYLSKARLSFAQLLYVVRALNFIPLPEEAWQGMVELNALRNALAHKLQPKDVTERLERLYSLCVIGQEPLPADYKKPDQLAPLAAECIHSLMGALSIVSGMAAVLRQGQ
ncbi:hypothetical protein [Pelomonas sp. KK5]|uniref:hypothetical protein n=1 Tax=Pelomonas sp. KK5 TaxID=1855730 RepID=UPI0011802592|nr:hypothetical protein [Pelomonas sp. KK5]